jgi:hypothetical protein
MKQSVLILLLGSTQAIKLKEKDYFYGPF